MTIAEKLQLIAENEQKVYQAGMASVSDWNAFWDKFQQDGNRTNYSFAFTGIGWNNDTFYPKYDIKCGSGYEGQSMFRDSNFVGDFQQRLDDCGVSLELANAGYLGDLFRHCYHITRVGEIAAFNATSLQTAFCECNNLEIIDLLVLSDGGGQNLYLTFKNCYKLRDITIDGVIDYDGTDFSSCTNLSKDSIGSIIGALSDTTSGYTITFSGAAVRDAFETAKGEGDGTNSDEWLSLVVSKDNWNITLVAD